MPSEENDGQCPQASAAPLGYTYTIVGMPFFGQICLMLRLSTTVSPVEHSWAERPEAAEGNTSGPPVR